MLAVLEQCRWLKVSHVDQLTHGDVETEKNLVRLTLGEGEKS